MAGFLTEVLEEIDETSGDLYWKLKSLLEHRDHAEFEVSGKSVVYFIPDPKIVLNRLLNKVGGKFLLMSATCQSPDVLENVFGIEPAFVEGETKFPGQLIQRKLGEEEVVNYQRWADEKFRRRYWNLLSRIMRRAKRPSFVPVHAFKYLPEKLREEISAEGIEVYKHQGIVFTTKMDRGADLKGMKSIIITKFPYPEREDPLLKGMERRLGKEAFWDYYRDMAERNFVQQVGRVLRSDEDVVEFWSPDGACHAGLRSWKGSISVETVEGSDT
jgi:Rad3-related DNA helicase